MQSPFYIVQPPCELTCYGVIAACGRAYTQLLQVNRTHLHWQFFYSGDGALPFQNITKPLKAGELVDDFVITKR
jgi:hypothetical protein